MKFFISFILAFYTLNSFGATARKPANDSIKTLCGVNKGAEEIRLEIVLEKKDDFSDATIVTVNSEKPKTVTGADASGFGFKKYEGVKLTLENGEDCKGSAVYNHYNAKMPMNPMEKLTLKCLCKK